MSVLAGAFVLGCSAPSDPGEDLQSVRPQLILIPYDTTTATTLVSEVTLQVPDTGAVTDTIAFFALGAFADTAFLEGLSMIQAGSGVAYPYSIIAGSGRIYYYKPNGDLWYREVQVQFNQLTSGGGSQLEDLFASTPTPANPLRFRDTDAATHGSEIIFTVSAPVSTGENANDPSFGFCLWVDFGSGGCVPGPGFGPDYTFNGNPSGSIRVRAFSRVALGLTMTLSRTEVAPVLHGRFRAITQAAGRGLGGNFAQQARIDTLRISIAPTVGTLPMPGAVVWVEARPIDSGGGHMHSAGTRPTGTFFTLSQGSQISDSAGGSRGSTSVVLDSTGNGTLTYRTSGVSGVERLIAHRDSLAGAVMDTAYVTIRIPGLAELQEGGNVDTIGVTTTHRDSHWGTPAMVAALTQLADSIKARYDAYAPGQRPAGFSPKLLANDMSLPWGGLFDYDVTNRVWSHPHAEHRDGRDADVRVMNRSSWDHVARCLDEVWPLISSHPRPIFSERTNGNHYHLRF